MLDPCPHCGKPALRIEDIDDVTTFWRVVCMDAYCMAGPASSLEGGDIAAWNRLAGLQAEVDGKRKLVQAQQGAYADLRAENLRLVAALIDIQALYGGTEAGEIARKALEES